MCEEKKESGVEVDVTPEMIEVGVECFYDWNPGSDWPTDHELKEIIRQAFCAMRQVQIVQGRAK